ncbi:camphor resistance protein CrcB [Microlunatus sagamiharensis]|uniref:Fluoride-specific ion channel FluC n=1 Tax=Microlunatus sagamiharensis TaxID=546874 RepID=A0A1H2NGA9_9ACTN|nr:CrcB family protein [Microlunatus sagamiharensis]SDV04463.1 camphor resistance protein CrcB [Microlunatus sagamiharensis]
MPARPAYRQPLLLLLVLLGGATGTLARWATGLAVPHVDRVPLGTLAVNVVGAFVLGALLEHLAGRGPDEGRRRALRVTLGTGFCGGFTTYSALANDTDALLRQGLVGHALGYVGSTLVLGLVASALGIATVRRGARGRTA